MTKKKRLSDDFTMTKTDREPGFSWQKYSIPFAHDLILIEWGPVLKINKSKYEFKK